jgi:hypothetical protein
MQIIPLCFKDDSFRSFNWVAGNNKTVVFDGQNLLMGAGAVAGRTLNTSAINLMNQYPPTTLYIKASIQSSIDIFEYTNSTTYYTASINALQTSAGFSYSLYAIPNPSGTTPFTDIIIRDKTSPFVQDQYTTVIDFIAIGTTIPFNNVNYSSIDSGGEELTISMPKRMAAKRVPLGTDVIQALGGEAITYTLSLPKSDLNTYNFLTYAMNLNPTLPFMFNTEANQGCGYITEVDLHAEPGWLGQSSNLANTGTQMLYDLTVTLTRADSDIDTSLGYAVNDLLFNNLPPPPPPPGTVVIQAVYNGNNYTISPITIINTTTGTQVAQGTSPITLSANSFSANNNYTASVYFCSVPSLFNGFVAWTGIPPSTTTINVNRRTVALCPQ